MLSYRKGEIPMSDDEKTNMCWIAGTIKTLKVDDKRAFMLVDVGDNSKFLPCTVWDDAQLIKILGHFKVEDFIRIVGWVRGWSQRKNDIWENHIDVRITAVRNNPPMNRKQVHKKTVQSVTQATGREVSNDGIPF